MKTAPPIPSPLLEKLKALRQDALDTTWAPVERIVPVCDEAIAALQHRTPDSGILVDRAARKAAVDALKENYGHCPYEIGVFFAALDVYEANRQRTPDRDGLIEKLEALKYESAKPGSHMESGNSMVDACIAIVRQHEAKPGTVITGDLRVSGGHSSESLVEQFKQQMLGYAKEHAEGLKAILSAEQASELRDNRAEFERALLEAHPGTPLGMTNGLYNQNSVEGAWRGWNLRKPEPVLGALERGAAAVKRLFDLASTPPDSGFTPEDVAKAVLDATGVKYHD